MPTLKPSVAGVWELLHHPIALGASTCLRIAPDRITQRRPILKNGVLSSELGAEGTLRIQDPCESALAVRAPPLPRLVTTDEAASGVELRVPVRASWVDVSAELTRSLTAKRATPAETRVVKLEAEGTRSGSRALVALRATLAGATCGEVRFLAEPWFDRQLGRIRLRAVALVPGAPGFPGLTEVVQRIEKLASAALPVDISSAPAALTALVQSFGKDLPEGVEIDSEMKKSVVERVHPEREGLVALVIFAGHTTMRVK
jgi:hypothetical protein